NPRSPISLFNKAITLSRLGRLNDAVRGLDKLLELFPGTNPARSFCGHVRAPQGNWENDAPRVLDTLLELYPAHTQSLAFRAQLHARLGNWAAAQAEAEQALLEDKSPSSLYQIAGVYALLTKNDPAHQARAIQLLTAALRLGYGHAEIEKDPDLAPI